jgi:hypothetical protein
MSTSSEKSSNDGHKSVDVPALFAAIEAAAEKRDFSTAEALRSELLQQAPEALTEIIEAAEIIEKEKAAGLDTDHLAIWDQLYSNLSLEEKNALFYSMKKVVLPPKKIILSHGAYNTRLFFIDSGKVTIVFPHKGKNTVLAQLGPGHLLGEYSFTSISLCSATAVTHSDVQLYCLENRATDGWHDQCPGLYEKIIDFCVKHGSFEDISRWKSLEKRDKPRYSVTGPLKGYLINKEGKTTETYFRGELTDMSRDGCAFEIKLSKKATARALLARQLLLQFSFIVNQKKITFDVVGKIVKVSFFMHSDYCVHIKFEKPISKAVLVKIVSQEE